MNLDINQIPEQMRNVITRWITTGEIDGSFMRAIFENNLKEACLRANPDDLKLLVVYVMFVHWEIPSHCHGSVLACDAWQKLRRKEGPIEWEWPT